MWYNSRPLMRRKLSGMLLAVLAVQLLGGMVFASDCFEPCPDDTESSSCPPVCTLCTTCTHAQTAIVQYAAAAAPLLSARPFALPAPAPPSSAPADDIFHVPLLLG